MSREQQREFPKGQRAPATFVLSLHSLRHDGLRWLDDSWHDEPAPSFSLGNDVGGPIFKVYYYTLENSVFGAHVHPMVQMVTFGIDGTEAGPIAWRWSSADEFLLALRDRKSVGQVLEWCRETCGGTCAS